MKDLTISRPYDPEIDDQWIQALRDMTPTTPEEAPVSTTTTETAVQLPEITVYGRPACGMCNATDRKLVKTNMADLAVHEQLADHPVLVQECKDLGMMEAPLVVVRYPDGTSSRWAGYRPDRLGQLARQLGRAD